MSVVGIQKSVREFERDCFQADRKKLPLRDGGLEFLVGGSSKL